MSIARTAATGGDDLHPDFLAWSSSLPVDSRMLREDCAGSVAHVRGLEAAGLLAADEAARLVDALAALPDRVASGVVILPQEEDVHMAVEAWLKTEVGDLAAKLHTGRSRNDQVATDFKLWTRGACETLREEIAALFGAVREFQARQGEVPLPAYTHRQVAIPTLARLWLDAALRAPLERDLALLDTATAEASRSPLGAGAIGGSTLPLQPDLVARLLGFQGSATNPVDAVGERDHALTLAFACTRIGLHLGRFAADIVEFASDGLCALGGAVACGSSMMPHKRNPDLFELVRGQAALRQGELMALLTTFHGLGTGYHRDLQQDKQVLFACYDGAVACLRMITLGLGHLRLSEEACVRALEAGDAIATDLTEALVAQGVPFRTAYARIGSLVAQQRGAGRRLVDLGVEGLVAAGLAPDAQLLDVRASARRRAARYPTP